MNVEVVEITPVVKSIVVHRSAGDAFRLFTDKIGAWWPVQTHTLAQHDKGQRTVRVTVEPRVGGRVFETLQDDRELEWGTVLAYEPGRLFTMEWRLGRPPEHATEVSVEFEPRDRNSCRVTLTHSNWECMGDDAEKMRDAYASGWVTVFEERFGNYAGRAN